MERRAEYLRVAGGCMAPAVPAGSWIKVDAEREPSPGDVVVARCGGRLLVKSLAEWAGRRWLVAARDCPPRPIDASVELVGVVALIVQTL